MAHPLTRRFLASSLLALGLLGAAPGCTDEETSLFIQGVLKPEPPNCVSKAESSVVLLGGGVVDRAFGAVPYTAALLIGNQLVARADSERLRVETSRVALEGAIVKVSSSKGAFITEYTTPGTGFVDPGNGREPGRGVFFATLVPGNVGVPGDVFIVRVSVFGKTIGGIEVRSSELLYTVEVCDGCLINYPAAAADVTGGTNKCVASPDAEVESPCQLGVDELIDCRLCSGSVGVCSTFPSGL